MERNICCLKNLPLDALAFPANTKNPKNGYAYYVTAYVSMNRNEKLVISTHMNGFSLSRENFLEAQKIINDFFTDCQDFLEDIRNKPNTIIDFTNLEWEAENQNRLDEVPPIQLLLDLDPDVYKLITTYARSRVGDPKEVHYSIDVPIYFNIQSVCFEVDENAGYINGFLNLHYLIHLEEAYALVFSSNHYIYGEAIYIENNEYKVPLTLQKRVEGTEKLYVQYDLLTLKGRAVL